MTEKHLSLDEIAQTFAELEKREAELVEARERAATSNREVVRLTNAVNDLRHDVRHVIQQRKIDQDA